MKNTAPRTDLTQFNTAEFIEIAAIRRLDDALLEVIEANAALPKTESAAEHRIPEELIQTLVEIRNHWRWIETIFPSEIETLAEDEEESLVITESTIDTLVEIELAPLADKIGADRAMRTFHRALTQLQNKMKHCQLDKVAKEIFG